MAETILVIGESGSGKSTSMRNLDPKETAILRVVKKPLPFKGWKLNYVPYSSTNTSGNIFDLSKVKPTEVSKKIIDILNHISTKMTHIKIVIIDDAQYVMSMEFMDRAKEGGWGKFTEIADHFLNIIKTAPDLRDDMYVAFLAHSSNVDDGERKVKKMKTIGNLLDEKITIEGLFTYVFYATVNAIGKESREHVFVTNSDGTTVAKSPMGMFETFTIPNDLKLVIDSIEKYNS